MVEDPREKQAAEREAKLAQALRDNLRRRKGLTPATPPKAADGGTDKS
jgi:hypothetical protein